MSTGLRLCSGVLMPTPTVWPQPWPSQLHPVSAADLPPQGPAFPSGHTATASFSEGNSISLTVRRWGLAQTAYQGLGSAPQGVSFTHLPAVRPSGWWAPGALGENHPLILPSGIQRKPLLTARLTMCPSEGRSAPLALSFSFTVMIGLCGV